MQKRSSVAFGLHSVIKGISDAPQHKAVPKELSERELKRRAYLKRFVEKNYSSFQANGKTITYVTERVPRGKSKEKRAEAG